LFGRGRDLFSTSTEARGADLVDNAVNYTPAGGQVEIEFGVLNCNLMVATGHLPIISCACMIGGFMTKRTMLARASARIFLAVGILAAAQDSREARDSGKVRPPLETVKASLSVARYLMPE
jgi:hypothetical protein